MTEKKVNSDLLKCENEFYIKSNQINSLLITKSAQNCRSNQMPIKTERISSTVLSRAKDFLAKSQTNGSIGQKCDLVNDDSNDSLNDSKSTVEMNFVLYETKDHSKIESEEEDNDSNEDSEEESSDSDSEEVDYEKIVKKVV